MIPRRQLTGTAIAAPRRVVLASLLLAAIAICAATTLWPGSAASRLADSHSAIAQATRAQERVFGAEPIVVSLEGNLATTLDPTNLHALVSLERRLASLPGVKTASGPGTFVQQTVGEVDGVIRQELAAARSSGGAAARQELSALLVRYGYTGMPSIDNESFVGQLVFGSGTAPKRRFAWLFPDDDHALVLVRPRAALGDTQTRALLARLRQLVESAPLDGVQTHVAASPLGTDGQLWVDVHARDVTTPAVLGWMNSVEARVLSLDPRLGPGPNLAALLETGAGDTVPSAAEVHSLLRVVPASFTAAVLSPDHTRAELSVGVPWMPSAERAALVDRVERVLSSAPKGVGAEPAGAIALSASSTGGLQQGWPWLLLAAALVILALLLCVPRGLHRTAPPVVAAQLESSRSLPL